MARLDSTNSERIPEGFYFVMGDNRNRSFDGRAWGLVPRELLQGRAYWVWWSYGEDEGTHLRTGFDFILTYLRYPVTIWSRTHWRESFRRIR
jgi:signal peptidase I